MPRRRLYHLLSVPETPLFLMGFPSLKKEFYNVRIGRNHDILLTRL